MSGHILQLHHIYRIYELQPVCPCRREEILPQTVQVYRPVEDLKARQYASR